MVGKIGVFVLLIITIYNVFLERKGMFILRFSKRIPEFKKHKDDYLMSKGFKRLKEPNSLKQAVGVSLPIMILLGIIIFAMLHWISPFSLKDFGIDIDTAEFSIQLNLILVIFSIILLTCVHEILHVIFIPNFIKSKEVIIGLTWFGGFVFCEKEILKKQFLLVSLAPLIVISFIIPLLLNILGMLSLTIKLLAILNAAASGVDVLSFLLVLKQIPKDSVIVMNGNYTYYLTK